MKSWHCSLSRLMAVGTACLAFVGLALLFSGCSSSKSRVVLYCAQDQEFAELVFDDFRKQTGLTIAPHYDTEANKSVSIYEELVREKDRPRCDVHWNNEILSTIRLQRQGLLEPYASPAAAPYPKWCRGPDDAWHAFGARARVLLVNTKQVPEAERPRSILELTEPRWKGKVGIAKPQFGTTATQAACLFEVLGPDRAKEFYRGLKANDVQVVPGNKQVAEGVSAGQFAVGITDTDDAMIEVGAGKPVALIFPDRDGHKDHPRLGTLFIPNTVAVIRGCPNPDGAKKLVDFLLSADVEKRLAESQSRQIPLNPKVKADLPPPMDRPKDAGGSIQNMEVDFGKAADLWNDTQAFLLKEFLQP
jgi:iron(III) transport system substrate-binding protein